LTSEAARGRARRTASSALGLTLAIAALACAALPSAAVAAWGAPFVLAPPGTRDTLPAQIAFARNGAAAVVFTTQDEDQPALSTAFVTLRSASRQVEVPRRIPGAQLALAETFAGRSLELLTGAGRAGGACCSVVSLIRLGPRGAFGRAQTVVGGLAGATLGALVNVAGGRLLVAVATEAGLWVAQSPSGDRLVSSRLLTAPSATPELLAATVAGRVTFVAWSAAGAPPGPGPRTISLATGAPSAPPGPGRTAVLASVGHRIDELALAPRGRTATAAWIESWFDPSGHYQSQLRVADLTARHRVQTVSLPGLPASGLAFAGDAAGDQAAAWKACDATGACTLDAATRPAGGAFSSPVALGAVDASQAPAVSVAPGGSALVAWVQSGSPLAAIASTSGAGFGPPAVLSPTVYAADITVAFGPAGKAIAAWSDAAPAPSVAGAVYRPG